MKIPCVALAIEGDKIRTLYTGVDKGEAIAAAKAEADKPSEVHLEIRVVAAIGSGIAWRRSVRPQAPAPAADDEDTSADAKALRDALKAKGVKVPPRIGIDALLKLAIDNGVEV